MEIFDNRFFKDKILEAFKNPSEQGNGEFYENEPAIKFYESIGAKSQDEWIGYRLEGQSLLDFAKK